MARRDIFTYHKVGSEFELGITTVTQSRFKGHLDFLSAAGKRFQNASDLVFNGANGDEVALTFDDGYESIYTRVFPELRDRGITGTVFPVVGAIGRDNRWDIRLSLKRFRLLSWEHLSELSRSGFEIGSHTVSHGDLTRMNAPRLRSELRDSKHMLEDRLGTGVTSIAFPFGRHNSRVICEAVDAGYTCGFASAPNGSRSVMAVGRMSVHAMDGDASLARMLGLRPGQCLEIFKNRLIANLALVTPLIKR